MMLTCVVGLDVVATGHGLSPWALGVISLVCALTVAVLAMRLWQGPKGSPIEARPSASLPAPIHRADPLTRLPDRTTFLGELARVIAARRLTYEEAEQLTGLDRTTIWRGHRSGALKASGRGRGIRFRRDELIRWMEGRS